MPFPSLMVAQTHKAVFRGASGGVAMAALLLACGDASTPREPVEGTGGTGAGGATTTSVSNTQASSRASISSGTTSHGSTSAGASSTPSSSALSSFSASISKSSTSKSTSSTSQGTADGGAGDGGTPILTCTITQYGAKGDGTTLNTKAIQAAIDACAAAGGGTVVVPKGNFLTGALFLKLGVNLSLLDSAVLLASKNIKDFPVGPSRFEGHFQDRPASLLNGEKLAHLRITGPGMLDGNGAAYWSANLPQGRPRLFFLRDSQDVVVSGVRFKNSPSWNFHMYNCQTVVVENSRFEIDAGADGPSTDGTDIDSSQDVTVRGCYFSVNDDCVVLKGNRYDGLNQTPASPPVSNVHVTNCTFARGKGALSFGTEATYIHDVEFDNSSVTGDFPMLRLKMRPDTPGQRYENINVHDIKANSTDDILAWELTHGTTVTGSLPMSVIHNVTVSNLTGNYGGFGNIAANKTTQVSLVTMKNFDVKVTTPTLVATGATGITMTNVVVNGKLWSATAANGSPGPI